ncbi:MAG TPA: flagellar biosynthesis protein FlhB [Syntrophomonadaceae bacterium]|nr:flagellar biosynthesis protein FlhB [Syntrophomonadaceae bacterium]
MKNDQLYFHINLQLFADDGTGEKTEKATPRRREEARKKGQVFKSTDLNSAVILIAGTTAIFLSFPYMSESLGNFTRLFLLHRTTGDFDIAYASFIGLEAIKLMAHMIWPVFLATFVAALMISYLQVGFVFSAEPLSPKLSKINPIEGFKRIFSKRALVELVKSVLKVVVTGYIAYTVVRAKIHIFPLFVDMELLTMMKTMGSIVFEIAIKTGIAFVAIGVLDYIYQWYEHEKSLMMSKYDVKQEYKQTEGDPLVKSRQRQIQRDVAMRRMMAEVPKADVVITNPTHFAVALQYDAQFMEAPVVLAKGQDYIAQRIRELANQHDIIIVENPWLARTLFYTIDIGDTVPEELYQAVAEVLAFVYKQKQKI